MGSTRKGKMMITETISSDCCGSEMSGIEMDHGVCPKCGEHCEVVVEQISAIELCRTNQPVKARKGSANRNYYGQLRRFRGYR